MVNDRQITISVGNNRKSVNWQPQTLMLSEFYEKLRIPSRSTETMQEYLSLRKSEQDDKKDIGGFVAGTLSGPRRKAGAVTGRDIITLDFDTIPPGGTEEILKRVDALGCGYCIYSTRKHSPASPRLRILLPLDRTVTADEYEPLARYMAVCIGIEFADPTTFEATRLMYWPSCCKDSEYIFTFGDKPMLSADGLLNAMNEKFGDWRDVSKWPQVPGADNAYKKLAMKQSDPLSKAGVVGAFCRTYDIYGAMDTYLDGIYAPVDDSRGRYTYLGGSTTGGAVVYDNGMFLYSHHSTDPCCGRLVNAFDLVRLHKFGDLDDGADPNTPTNRLPSYTAMCNLAVEDARVSRQLAKERADSAVSDFSGLTEAASSSEGDNLDWTMDLELNRQTGTIKATIDNIWLILENDPNLRGKFALNEFAGTCRGAHLTKEGGGQITIIRASTGTSRRSTRLPATAKSTVLCPCTARSTSSTMCRTISPRSRGTATRGSIRCLWNIWGQRTGPTLVPSPGKRLRRLWRGLWSRGASMTPCSFSWGRRASESLRSSTR